ncbi:TetR/AcrR family transcriptional regulator [Paenibacillus beijingensis]|uniref:TetR family transcriptional regulator n=1 Tax=Paenibacillus beijingensis TaxID=1126833 RepID=A0A0D5NMS9_9BACL|nr:TetR/AcrR family transcriptional regulator [Paenibacillus beijingensis]AJY76302.1 TetR family transcriptional regulator [Paenibacillus beijingensis]
MNGFEKRAVIIKEKIMSTTLDMMKKWDPKKIRIADISKQANVSQVTIYNYFGSKETLVRESFKSYIDKSVEAFKEQANKDLSFKEMIEYILLYERNAYDFLSPGLIQELMLDDRDINSYIEEQYNGVIIPLMIRIIEKGKKEGEVSEKVTPRAVLAFVRMYMAQSKALLETGIQQDDFNVFAEELLHLFFYGICGKE